MDNSNPEPRQVLISGEAPLEDRLKELRLAFSDAEKEIDAACEENKEQVRVVAFACIIVVFIGAIMAWHLYHFDYSVFPEGTYKLIFFIASKLIIASALVSIVAYLFKLLKSYLHIYQRNRHRKVIIKSMAGMIGAGKENIRNEVYKKLLDIIIHFDDSGLLGVDADFKSAFSELAENLRSVKEKSEE